MPKSKTKDAPIVAYKGFDKDLQCRGFQYEVGKTYLHEGPVVQCSSGFHVCQSPLDVLDFYDFSEGNRFARVQIGGEVDRSDDKKWACAELTIAAELAMPDFIRAGIEWVVAACKADGTVKIEGGDYATNASSGHYAKNASSGHYAKNASSGHYATNASSGHYAKNASSGHSATNASSGHSAKNASSGDYAKNASSGHYAKNSAEGKHSVIAGAGRNTRAKGVAGVWISLAEYKKVGKEYRCVGFASGQVGQDGVPADTWLIAKDGKLVPA